MTPAARAQAAIECLDQVIAAAREGGAAADTLVQRYFAARRYAGSKDRAAVRDLVFAAVRRAGDTPVSGRAALLGLAADQPELADLFGAGGHGPAALEPGEPVAAAGIAPPWLEARLRDRFGDAFDVEAPALLGRAPLDLRVNPLRPGPLDLPVPCAPVAGLPIAVPHALRAETPFNVEPALAYAQGRIEVQDAGSQAVAALCAAAPGETVIDLCAGAGGKTLALAADMRGGGIEGGRLIACDTDRGRLRRLGPRADRAGAVGELRLLDPGREMAALEDLHAAADVVLVDAPCGGSGTWRRNPEARWRLTPDRLARLVQEQSRLLRLGAALVRPGGRLIYAVCSVLVEEGPAVAQAFAAETGWRIDSAHALTPHAHGCDGFFIARALPI